MYGTATKTRYSETMSRISQVPPSKAGWFGILFGLGMMERAIGNARLLPLKLKTLASIQAATLIGCPF